MASGYRIAVKSCETNGSSTRLTVTNNGIAPLYRDAFFAIGDTHSTTSLKGLLPGQEINVEIPALFTSTKKLKIVSDYILDTQEIEFEADLKGSASGIENVRSNDNQTINAPIYNLAGQHVKKDYKGIVIVNGKKHISL